MIRGTDSWCDRDWEIGEAGGGHGGRIVWSPLTTDKPRLLKALH